MKPQMEMCWSGCLSANPRAASPLINFGEWIRSDAEHHQLWRYSCVGNLHYCASAAEARSSAALEECTLATRAYLSPASRAPHRQRLANHYGQLDEQGEPWRLFSWVPTAMPRTRRIEHASNGFPCDLEQRTAQTLHSLRLYLEPASAINE